MVEAVRAKTKAAEAAIAKALEKDWKTVSGFLREHPGFIQNDDALLADLNLRLRTENVVDFGPAALTRLSEARAREADARVHLEALAQANFNAQAQAHAAVIDILDSRNHSDLARRLDEIAQLRFGLVSGVLAIETPGSVPAGWRRLSPGMTDRVLDGRVARMGQSPHVDLLFSQLAEGVRSCAMVRLAIGQREGVLAFGAPDKAAFTPDMGAELIAFLARVVERTAERWPIL
jgi:uncharacterized protein YigA (DUF484 family)